MIIITGGAGFIGSAFAWKCNVEGRTDLILVDELRTSDKWLNLVGLKYAEYMHKQDFLDAIIEDALTFKVDAIVHMGACSATTEQDGDYLMENNYRYTQILAKWALRHGVRFIYASSAATYGEGEHGFSDEMEDLSVLKPINRYGYSKHLFDLWATRHGFFDRLCGLKFFNVFGPNEFHKGSMQSVMCKFFPMVRDEKRITLFKSYRDGYSDGGQQRDFVYVKDVVSVMWWLMTNSEVNGLFNVGTGQARSWNDVAGAMFSALGLETAIEYVDMPENLINQYQYFTEATMDKLKAAGCPVEFHSLEEAVADYISSYLSSRTFLKA